MSVKFNLNIAPADKIRKYIDSSHGSSMIAVCMLDNNNANLNIDVVFDSALEVDTFAEYVINVWNIYEPIPTLLRSYKVDDKYLSTYKNEATYADIELSDKIEFPSTIEHFCNKKAIIDVKKTSITETNANLVYTFSIYKWRENKPRVLTVSTSQ